MTNLTALNRTLRAVGGLDGPERAAQVELVRSLARAIDAQPRSGLAALFEQYREALKDLLADDHGDEFEKLLASLRSESAVGDPSS